MRLFILVLFLSGCNAQVESSVVDWARSLFGFDDTDSFEEDVSPEDRMLFAFLPKTHPPKHTHNEAVPTASPISTSPTFGGSLMPSSSGQPSATPSNIPTQCESDDPCGCEAIPYTEGSEIIRTPPGGRERFCVNTLDLAGSGYFYLTCSVFDRNLSPQNMLLSMEMGNNSNFTCTQESTSPACTLILFEGDIASLKITNVGSQTLDAQFACSYDVFSGITRNLTLGDEPLVTENFRDVQSYKLLLPANMLPLPQYPSMPFKLTCLVEILNAQSGYDVDIAVKADPYGRCFADEDDGSPSNETCSVEIQEGMSPVMDVQAYVEVFSVGSISFIKWEVSCRLEDVCAATVMAFDCGEDISLTLCSIGTSSPIPLKTAIETFICIELPASNEPVLVQTLRIAVESPVALSVAEVVWGDRSCDIRNDLCFLPSQEGTLPYVRVLSSEDTSITVSASSFEARPSPPDLVGPTAYSLELSYQQHILNFGGNPFRCTYTTEDFEDDSGVTIGLNVWCNGATLKRVQDFVVPLVDGDRNISLVVDCLDGELPTDGGISLIERVSLGSANGISLSAVDQATYQCLELP